MSSGIGLMNIDLVEILFTLFFLFFVGLVFYLHRESKREGYPLITDLPDHRRIEGFPAMPPPKTYYVEGGRTVTVPSNEGPDKDFRAEPAAKNPGSPLDPTGDPLTARFGPGAWSHRPDIPVPTLEGKPRIVPLRVADGYEVDECDIDPRGMPVHCADGEKVGDVKDLWIDLAEPDPLFVEVETSAGSRLVPFGFAEIDKAHGRLTIDAIYSHQFANVPQLANPDQVTMLEEDKIMGYFGAGLMFADKDRGEPLI